MRRFSLLLAAVLMATPACVSTPTKPPTQVATENGVIRVAQVTNIRGVVTAPAGLIANNGAGVIANNGGGLIANNGAGYRLSATGGWAGVPAMRVQLVDQFGRPVPGVEPVTTNEKGEFELKQVTVDANWVVEAQAGTFKLATIVQPTKATPTFEVNPASTLVTEHLRKAFGQQKVALKQVPVRNFQVLTQSVEEVLKTEGASIDLRSTEQAAASFGTIAGKHDDIQRVSETLIRETRQATDKAIQNGQIKPEDLNEPVVKAKVTGMVPSSGTPGTIVTVQGSGFPSDLTKIAVTIGGQAVVVKSATATALRVLLPAGAKAGAVAVTVNGQAVEVAEAPTLTLESPGKMMGNYPIPETGNVTLAFLAVDPEGGMWVGRRDSSLIEHVDLAGTPQAPTDVGGTVQGLGITPDNKLFVVQPTKLEIFNANRGLEKSVTIPSNLTAVRLDAAGNAWGYNAQNMVVGVVGGTAGTPFQIGQPVMGLAGDQTGNVWVAYDTGAGVAARKYDVTGQTLTAAFMLPGQPQIMAVDALGNLWVQLIGETQVQKIGPTGTVLGTFPVGPSTADMTVGADGFVSVLDDVNKSVIKLAP